MKAEHCFAFLNSVEATRDGTVRCQDCLWEAKVGSMAQGVVTHGQHNVAHAEPKLALWYPMRTSERI